MRVLITALALALLPGGCIVMRPADGGTAIAGVTLISPKCAGVESCLLGQVVEAESARPLPRAAVFLQREETDPNARPDRIVRLTDDQGVFTVADAPPGRYRLAVYKDARRVEVRGLDLGAKGTTMVPVRL